METAVIIKDMNEHYPCDRDIKNLFKYIAGKTEKKEEVRYYGGRGVPKDPLDAADKMIRIQRHFGKAKKRRIYHYTVSFPKKLKDVNRVKRTAEALAAEFFKQYQVYYGIHEDTDNLHIHLAVNAVSYTDGRKWHKSRKEFKGFVKDLKDKVKETMQEHK